MKSLAQMIGFVATLLVFPVLSYAQGTLYKWTDSRGTIHYSNTPTGPNAAAVDDTLPPASSFKSPTPPPETAEPSSPSPAGEAAPGSEGNSPAAGDTGSTPAPDTTADGSQPPPAGETIEGEPAPASGEEPGTDAQQTEEAKPQLTPEQEQALRDSPM
jgi:uncharacterized protein DUF4124